MLFSTVTTWLASLLSAALHDTTPNVGPTAAPTPAPAPLRFELRHLHAVSPDARVVFSDVPPSARGLNGEPESYGLRPRTVKTHRPASMDAFHRARARSMRFRETEAIGWDEIEVEGPDVEDRETLLELAKMTNNAYLAPDEQGWYDLGGNWTVVSTCSVIFIIWV